MPEENNSQRNGRIDLDQLRADAAAELAQPRATPEALRDRPLSANEEAENGPEEEPYDGEDDAPGIVDPNMPTHDQSAEKALWKELQAKHGRAVEYGSEDKIIRIYEHFWAARFACHQAVVYDETRKTFYLYERGSFKEASEDRVRAGIGKLMLWIARRLDLDGLERFRSSRSLNGVVATLRGLVAEPEPFARSDQRFIVLQNGVLLLKADGEPELVPHDARYRATSAVAIDYDAQRRCPRFEGELLAPMLPEPEDRRVLQKYFGMCLLGNNLAQRFILLRGEGKDGKSQLVSALTRLVGLEATIQLRTEHLGQRFEMGLIGPKSLLVGVDVPEDFLGAERSEIIKGLVGGDDLTAEIKNSMREARVKGDKCLVITCNGRLRVRLRGDQKAWRRRIIVLECAAPPADRPPIAEFGSVLLKEEGPGILNWALEGLRGMLAAGGQIELSEAQQERADALLGESDALAIYLRESLERAGSNRALTVEEIWKGYVAFCESREWAMAAKGVIERSLTELMPRLFDARRSRNISDPRSAGSRVRGYRCVRWRDGMQPEGLEERNLFLDD